MGIFQRFSLVFRSKANRVLDRAEDPRETLDLSYQKQLELLTKVRRGLAEVATSRKRLELQVTRAEQQSATLHKQAQGALQMGNEALAREALKRRAANEAQLEGLRQQYAQLQAEEEKLTTAAQQLQARVDAFRTRKETIKATYTAAEAQTRITEAVSGISSELGDVGLAVQRAEDRTAELQARAGALDELLAVGALHDVTGGGADDIQLQLNQLSAEADIENELAAMRQQLSAGPQARALPGSTGQAQPPQVSEPRVIGPDGV